jgi:CheY-like chemotaxis protein
MPRGDILIVDDEEGVLITMQAILELEGYQVAIAQKGAMAIDLLRRNAERNEVALEAAVLSWNEPAPLLARAPFGLVLAADVLYERRNVPVLADLLPRLGGEVLLADPGRPRLRGFLDQVGTVWERPPVYRLR